MLKEKGLPRRREQPIQGHEGAGEPSVRGQLSSLQSVGSWQGMQLQMVWARL